jgi:hypothetical protein
LGLRDAARDGMGNVLLIIYTISLSIFSLSLAIKIIEYYMKRKLSGFSNF